MKQEENNNKRKRKRKKKEEVDLGFDRQIERGRLKRTYKKRRSEAMWERGGTVAEVVNIKSK